MTDKIQATSSEKTMFLSYLASELPDLNMNVRDGLLSGFEFETLDHVMNDMIVNIMIDAGSEPTNEVAFLRDELRGVIHNLDRLLDGFEAFKTKLASKESMSTEAEAA